MKMEQTGKSMLIFVFLFKHMQMLILQKTVTIFYLKQYLLTIHNQNIYSTWFYREHWKMSLSEKVK